MAEAERIINPPLLAVAAFSEALSPEVSTEPAPEGRCLYCSMIHKHTVHERVVG